MAKNFKKKRLFTVAALTVLLALAMLVFAACETGKTYTLTFETGNGSAVSPIKAKAGDKIDLPDEPTLDGHRFDGWYLSEDFSGEKAALPETMPAENRTYYAKFTAIKTATLTLDAAGGVLETSVFELEAGEKVWRIVSQAVPSLTGAVFGGWFNGNSAVTENTVMPANGLTLTARYKASYVVEVYLEDLNGEYGAPTDQVTFEGGSDWLGREVRLGASVLKAPEGFLLDQTKTQPITLVAGENVYKAYFYRADGYVYYFVNTPQGAEAEGEMDFATVTYGAPHTVSESMFTVRGYRFAGWSDSPEGEVVYAAGDEISQVKGTIMLYARWNYGATDAGGGADRIYLLMESPLKAVLERPVLGEKTGSYDPDTRLFEFEIADGRTLKGRMHADGKGFAYFDGDMTLTLTQVDGTAAGKATIALDGLDAALYTPENGAATEGSYTRVSPSVYQFSSESVRFRFRIEKSDGEDVFVMSDGYEGTYYYYNGGISYPVVILDGFGAAAYLADSESSLLTGAYAPSGEEIEVTYPNGDGEVRFLCRLGEEQGRTTSGDVVTVTVFYLADDTRGEYAIEDLSGAETYFYSDGFGKAYYGEGAERREVDYVYYREHGYYVVIDGKINYFGFVSMYLDGKNVFGCLNMTAKTGGLAEHNTVWTEENARSGFTVKLRILDSRTAAIEVSMTNGRWQRVVTGENTYDGDAKIYHFAAEWFAPDTENIKYEQLLAPFYGDFYYKSQGTSSFVIADDAFSEYTVYDGSAVYTLKCDGFGKGSLLKRGDANSVPIVYDYRHGYETENASYGFISFTLQMSLFTVRVNEDTKEGQLVTEFTELENRLPEQGEKFCFAAVDESGKGSAYISFPDGSGGFVAGIDGAYTAVVFGNADGETVYVEYTFTADFFAQGFEALAQDGYASFVFRYYPAMGNYFFVFDSSEQENYVIDDGESRIEFSVNGDGTAWLNSLLCAVTRDGDEFVLTTASGARGVVRVVGDGTAQLASSERGTYFALADGTPTLEKEMLFLDGFGGATMQRYVAATETSESRIEDVASGTYVRLDSASGYYEYDVSFADGGYENFRFAYGTITVGNSAVAVYILYDESQEESFETSDGGTLLIDAYGQATFEDASGEKRAAIASRAADTVIEGRELMRVRVLDADGKNYGAEKTYAVSEENGKKRLLPVDGGLGVYFLLEGDKILSESKLVLDGLGGGVLYCGETQSEVKGTYTSAERENEWIFRPDGTEAESFRFALMRGVPTTEGESFDLFAVYAEQWECTLLSADWEVAAFGGYGSGTFIDRLGRVFSVYCEIVDENTVRIYGAAFGEMWLTADFLSGTFELYDQAPAE
ncbi:MAG: InlB B-repeat-containing protein [Subdoligranulum sp.]|jgi:cell wall/surface repeat protein|nr:InlB B-repeat-containing protein [Subdoligranulum sp.]